FPEEILQNQRLKDFSLKLRERAVNRPEFCVLDGVEYLLAGHKCILMSTIRLLALFPVARVDQQVASKKQLLTWLVLISLLISISLGLFVSGSILRPLGALQLGITALRERNFAYRLPDLGGDEFGHLASIFNDTLVDLEEMHVASIVQEKLMTQMAEPLSAGKLNFFGQTISLAGMGGDYFEVCETDQGTPSLVLGDVPERGAGTSLILAFVKSAIMQLHELSSEPEDFVAGLHDLILRSSREGQYKTFCLQYIVFGNGSELQIVNAGLPNPIIIDHRADVLTELRLQSLPAGSPENANWKSTCVKLEEGQSLVCFTGGILRNAAVNAEQIADLLRRTKSADPQTFSSHFLEEYFKLVSRGECADDVSLLIIHHTAA
ncbi:MAG: SpoIIE family protein phosphatase, partial [Candidatus Riflebacteria bacterium]|nr:SpoIIE family protein phosphatase [Candidatus Riflebacteria bacterium]